MTDNLGAVETDMPDDIKNAVEQGQKVAAGRIAYGKWLLTGEFDGEPEHLLLLIKQQQRELNEEKEPAPCKQCNDLLQSIETSEGDVEALMRRCEAFKTDIRCLEDRVGEILEQRETVEEELANARRDIEALVRSLRILARGV
jgi:hypothetical protein